MSLSLNELNTCHSVKTSAKNVRFYQVTNWDNEMRNKEYNYRADSWLAPSHWETTLQSNVVSHWLGANLESALNYYLSRMEGSTQVQGEHSTSCVPFYQLSHWLLVRSLTKYTSAWCHDIDTFLHYWQNSQVTAGFPSKLICISKRGPWWFSFLTIITLYASSIWGFQRPLLLTWINFNPSMDK